MHDPGCFPVLASGRAGDVFGRPGVLRDGPMLASLFASAKVALPVAGLAVALGTANAFLLERHEFPGKALLANVMLWPPVIPGAVLGISILAFSSRVANGLEDMLAMDLEILRPGLPLVGAGLVAFLMSFGNFNTTLILVGSEPPLPVYMYGQMREGATPALDADSLVLMLGTGAVAALLALVARPRD